RGSKKVAGKLFGPYPNAGSVREALLEVQKLFGIRPCTDIFFANRSRPCLQFQIKRCSGPCVGEVTREQYAEDMREAIQVLEGRDQELIAELAQRMEHAASSLEFERAARLRDRIQAVKSIQSVQSMNSRGKDDVDAIACVELNGQYCVAVVFVRGGKNLGTANFFPKPGIAERDEVLSSFITQYYLSHDAPDEIIIDTTLEENELIATTISQHANRPVELRANVRGQRSRWLEMARGNAELGLRMRQSTEANMVMQMSELAAALNLSHPPSRMECFDISHTMGEATVASCVVFNSDGPLKADYRRFNIEGLAPGDDYGALRQAITRRYSRIKKGEVPLPDVLFIDGGENQLAVAVEVLKELDIQNVKLVGVAKGTDRRAGQERLFIVGNNESAVMPNAATLPPDSAALHLIQRIRDEAHRFAITGHRQRRGKARRESILESVAGLGPRKRRQLLQQFGGMQGVKRASSEDLQQVKGISRALADNIFSILHPE
ncbi:MAG TPA: excinuclease ABC subunit UvrC, partial [Steroidobacteraceae bacterium]|nr:excinuclease ABC subunit UvrC [Steroidobacteraceae bacterium]